VRSALRILLATFLLCTVAMFASALLPAPTMGQTPTLVTGTVKDVNGVPYSFAKVSASLTGIPPNVNATILVNGIPTAIGGQQNASADASGNFTMNLFCNTAGGGCSVISPSGTQWQFTVNENGTPPPLGTGPQTCSATITVTGAAQAVSGSFAACPALSNGGGGTGGGTAVIVPTGFTAADYQLLEGTGTTSVDSTGQNGPITFGGSPPAWFCNAAISLITNNLQCLQFSINQFANVPSTLDNARTIHLLMYFQPDSILGTNPACPLLGNNATAIGVCALLGAGTATVTPNTNGVWSWEQYNANTATASTTVGDTGLFVLTFACPSSGNAQIWVNTAFESSWTLGVNGLAPCTLPTGNYTLGGPSGGFFGNIIRAVFVNNIPANPGGIETPAQINTNATNILTWGAQVKNLSGGQGNTNATPFRLDVGDSIDGGNLGAPFVSSSFLPTINGTAFKQQVLGMPGVTSQQLAFNGSSGAGSAQGPFSPNTPLAHIFGTLIHTGGGPNILELGPGTNDICSSGTPANNVVPAFQAISSLVQQGRLAGFTVIPRTLLSRTSVAGCDAAIQAYNLLLHQHYKDIGAATLVAMDGNPLVGATGAANNTAWFVNDFIHPLFVTSTNLMAQADEVAVSRFLGNKTWETANTYSTTAPAPIAITGCSAVQQTATCTVAAGAPVQRNCVVIVGETPAGYNSPASQCWKVQTSTGGTSFTFNVATSGLGVSTVNGTVTWPVEQNVDAFKRLVQCTTCNMPILSCQGQTEPTFSRIESTSAWTITPFASETIDGLATMTTPVAVIANPSNFPIVRLDPIDVIGTGCTGWKASIQ
jgi:hypothetical protein